MLDEQTEVVHLVFPLTGRHGAESPAYSSVKIIACPFYERLKLKFVVIKVSGSKMNILSSSPTSPRLLKTQFILQIQINVVDIFLIIFITHIHYCSDKFISYMIKNVRQLCCLLNLK